MVATDVRSHPVRPSRRKAVSPRKSRPRLMLAVCAGVMAVTMADVIAATWSIPLLRDGLAGVGESTSSVQWVSTAYFVPFAALLAVAGRLADLIGQRVLLALGAAVFTLAACGVIVTPGWEILLVCRAIQGLGAAAMIPASLGLLLSQLPVERRGAAIAAWSAAGGLGAVVLHAGGGWVAQIYGWRALFVPSMLLGLALLVASAGLPHIRRRKGRLPDMVGVIMLAGGIAALVSAISKGRQWGWDSPQLLACAVGALALLGGALIRSGRHPVPAVDIGLWRQPTVRWGWALSLMYGLTSFPLLAWAPAFLQEWGYGGWQTGLFLAPMSTAVMITGRLAGTLGQRYGFNFVIYLGGALVTVAGVLVLGDGTVAWHQPLLVALFGDAAPSWPSLAALMICGMGMGCLSTGASTVSTLSSDPAQYATAVGASMTARQAGGAIGVAAAAVVVERPILGGPMAGYASVFAAVMALAAITATMALLRIWMSREGALRASKPANGDPTEMVAIPRATLLALRAALVEVAAAASDLLPPADATAPGVRCRCHPHLDPLAAAVVHEMTTAHLPSRPAAPTADFR
ncbi:MFS transporter (plasmid) [Streptosporangium sp. CA-135522]|uniref:MFS transporter n=1 Tax=Streptosporangium sp. CA-135522 TaxID=3240072 RepID=UPI003D8AC356